MHGVLQVTVVAVGVAAIVWGAEAFAEHLSVAAVRLGVSAFALAVLLAGAEPEELAAARRGVGEAAVAGVVGSFAYAVTMAAEEPAAPATTASLTPRRAAASSS